MELMDPLIGKELGNYRLARRLGQGSCGVVYLGEHVKLGTPFAVKILHPILAKNEESAARFLREARTAARINHENVVFIADFDIEPGIGPYFIMEFLDGYSLREALDRDAPFSSQRIGDICEQICQPLATAHRHGVIHRDLKPENILLIKRSGKERVKILDFGIAKITRDHFPEALELTRSGRVLGTPRYFSPEQAQGKEIDHRSDIYSFGIILYEMLTGKPAFDGQTPEEMMLQHLTKMPEPLDPEKFPSELHDLMMWILAKSPNDRPDHMEEVWELLQEALSLIHHRKPNTPSSPKQASTTYGSFSRASVIDQTSGYHENGSPAAPSTSLVNRTIPLGTTPARLPHEHALSQEEHEYLDQETTFLEKSSPSALKQAIRLHPGEPSSAPTQQSFPPEPEKLNHILPNQEHPEPSNQAVTASPTPFLHSNHQHTHLEKKTLREETSLPPPNVVIDPSLPVEFFARPDGEEQTATFSEATKQSIQTAVLSQKSAQKPVQEPAQEPAQELAQESAHTERSEAFPGKEISFPQEISFPAQEQPTENTPGFSQAQEITASTAPAALPQKDWLSPDTTPPDFSHLPPPPLISEPAQPESGSRQNPPPVFQTGSYAPFSHTSPPIPRPLGHNAIPPGTLAFHPARVTGSFPFYAGNVPQFMPSLPSPTPPAPPLAPKTQAEVDALLANSATASTTGIWMEQESLASTRSPWRWFLGFALLVAAGWGIVRWWSSTSSVTNPSLTEPCFGRVRVQTTPSHAELWQGEQRLGLTPYIYRGRCNQHISLQIKHPGYGTHVRLIQIAEGESDIRIPLSPKITDPTTVPPGRPQPRKNTRSPSMQTVLLVANPPASVYHQRKYICTTPCMVQGPLHGRRWYRLRRKHYHSRLIRIRFSPRHSRYRYHLRRR